MKIINIGLDMYIYSRSESKKKTFGNISVCPSEKLVYTKTWDRLRITFDPIARRFAELDPIEIFIDFSISRDQIRVFVYFSFFTWFLN